MPLNRKRPPVTIEVPNVPRASYELSNSGTFTEGDLEISRQGLRIADDRFARERKSPRGAQDPSGGPSGALEDPRAARETPIANPRGGDDAGDDLGAHAADSGDPSVVDGPDDAASLDRFNVALEELRVLGVVGRGSSGVVQRAVHAPTGVHFAVKTVQMNVQAEVRKNLLAELRALHQIRSPHVVPCVGAFFDDGAVSIVLEFMDGGSLSDVTRALGRIPERHLAAFAAQIVAAFEYLHDVLRIVHRDVKPTNVLVSAAGDAKVSDFGVSGRVTDSVAQCHSWVGTVTYMSPERISGEKYAYDSDVWSLGLSLVECAVGRFPYPPAPEEPEDEDRDERGDGARRERDEERSEERSEEHSEEHSEHSEERSENAAKGGGGLSKDAAERAAEVSGGGVGEGGSGSDRRGSAGGAASADAPPAKPGTRPLAARSPPMGFWDLLDHIVREPAPVLPRRPPAGAASAGLGSVEGRSKDGRPPPFSDAFRAFVGACLRKTPAAREDARTLAAREWLDPTKAATRAELGELVEAANRIRRGEAGGGGS